MKSNSRLVYSTAGNNLCDKCGKALAKCKCLSAAQSSKTGDGIVRLSRETKGRKGKGVTLISGLELNNIELKALAKKLKALCGSGGTVRDQVIEIQGDHRSLLKTHLEKTYTVKLSGG